MTPVHRNRSIIASLPVALALLAALVGSAGAQESCSVREVERWLARLDDGRHVYVEPTDLVRQEDRVLLAGTPTYVVAPGAVGIDAEREVGSIAGLMLGPGRELELVPWPVERPNLRLLRAAPAAAGGWLAIIGEMDRPFDMPDSSSLLGLWYGEWDGRRWTNVEPIPMPPRRGVRFANPSSVVPFGDGFVFGLPYEVAYDDRGGQVLFREGGAWRWETILASHGIYVELWVDDAGVLRAAVVATDRAVARDTNSVMEFVRDPVWRSVRLMIRGGRNPVINPRAVRSGDDVILTWRRWIAPDWHTQALAVAADSTALATIDPDMSYLDAFTATDGRATWLTEHVAADDTRTLRFTRHGDDGFRALGETASPFKGKFAAERAGRDTILVTGPRFTEDPTQVPLVTLALRYAVTCPDR